MVKGLKHKIETYKQMYNYIKYLYYYLNGKQFYLLVLPSYEIIIPNKDTTLEVILLGSLGVVDFHWRLVYNNPFERFTVKPYYSLDAVKGVVHEFLTNKVNEYINNIEYLKTAIKIAKDYDLEIPHIVYETEHNRIKEKLDIELNEATKKFRQKEESYNSFMKNEFTKTKVHRGVRQKLLNELRVARKNYYKQLDHHSEFCLKKKPEDL
jgi:hypothetical protein